MDELLTVKEVAKVLKTNQATVYRLISNGYIKCMKLGCIKVRRKTLDNFLEMYDGFDLNGDDPKRLEAE